MSNMTQDTFLNMRIAPEIKEILDELRKLEKDLPSRSEMVRRLIVRAVDPHSWTVAGPKNADH